MIIAHSNYFVLHTKDTTYAFRIMDSLQAEHLYYGKKLHIDENGIENGFVSAIVEKHTFAPGNTVNYNQNFLNFSLEDACLEFSSLGKGDMREPSVEMIFEDGSRTVDFVFESYEIGNDVFKSESGLPYARGGEQLVLTFKEKSKNVRMLVSYCVFEDSNVITRKIKIINDSDNEIKIEKLMSFMTDFDKSGYKVSTFTGGWTREMNRKDTKIEAGKFVIESRTGTSSNRANPFFMLSNENTDEDNGECYGFNLIYSGNHYSSVSVSSFGKTRVMSGINPEGFSWTLEKNEMLESPEAVMTYSANGFNKMSQNMHGFIRKHIIREQWQSRERPILLNSWEASYFDINEAKLLKLAKKAAETGIELFVMDDGWFGNRNDDRTSLGDWNENLKKLPGGLKGITEKVKALGLKMGIWVEPEMINVESECYKKHPDWCMDIPGREHSEGRNQRILDLSRQDVQNFIIDEMSKVFSMADISYVKWDMNRVVSDAFSRKLSCERQGEVLHRYVLGLYRCMRELTERFPDILFEGCASGGNRFDLGILAYFPQIWGSDDTDAICRAAIQTGYSYGYPMECVGAHVSGCPNHQTLRKTPLETRFSVAAFGSLGYECNLCDMKNEEIEAIKKQIELYKKWRSVFQKGTFYRGRSFFDKGSCEVLACDDSNITEWTVVSEDKKQAVGMILQKLVAPNVQYHKYVAKGLDSDTLYHFESDEHKLDIRNFGDLVNTVSPIHLKPDSLMLDIVAKKVKMDGESESLDAYGDMLMFSGVKLKQAFSGTGYNGEVRHFQDFSSRMYFMSAMDANEL